jgi:protein-disulfide isomerase
MDQNNTTQNVQKEQDHFLPISILVAAILISGSLIYTSRGTATGGIKNEALIANNAAAVDSTSTVDVSALQPRDVVIGDAKAPITLIEYGDYQCPFCGRWYTQTEKPIRDAYVKTGKVRFIFRNFAFLGTESTEAAEAAECSKDQGKFGAYHDALYDTEQADGQENNGDMNRDLFIKLAKNVGMDVDKFTTCYDGNTYAAQVTADRTLAGKVGVQGTPATYVNGVEAVDSAGNGGALPYSVYQTIFDKILAGK